MKNTVYDTYERSRKLLQRFPKKELALHCDVMGVIRTIFPNMKDGTFISKEDYKNDEN